MARSSAAFVLGVVAVLSVVAYGAAASTNMRGAVETKFGTYVPTPAGLILAECVHDVPSDAIVEKKSDHTLVTAVDGTRTHIPHCDTWGGERPMMLHTAHPQFPADYDGWLEYTAAELKDGFDSFLGDFSIPDTPAQDPQVLFLFTGLQNINWIPITTPLPSGPFDIIQPVLQFPSNFDPSSWSVRSWWVTLQAGAFASTETLVNPGDKIFGNMTRTGADSFFIGSRSVNTGKTTNTNYKDASRLANQPWAYTTLECYGCQDCSTEPTKPCLFTDMILTSQGKNVEVKWQANPFPSHNRKCHESIDIKDSATVTIGFQS